MIFSFLLFLLPGVQSYSLFDYNSKPRGNENERRTNGAVGKETPSTSNGQPRKRNFDRNYDPHSHHPQLPPTESTLSAGLFHTCAVVRRVGVECGERPCGPAKCWGHDDRGQSTPPPGAMFTQLSAGGFFTCGLGLDGRAACWGAIDHPPKSLESLSREELSNVNHARRMQREEEGWRGDHSQRHVNGGGHYVQLSSGMRHACAISRDSEVHCWGRDDYGEGSPPDGAFVQISAGNSFTCGVRPNGAAICWGKNDMGQGSPPPYPENVFQQVSASIGGDHACGVLLEDGGVRCWGDNGRGQSEDQDGDFLRVSAGTRTSCALHAKSNSADPDSVSTTIHCWGSRSNALLDHLVVEKKNGGNSYGHEQISLGNDHACVAGKIADESSESAQAQLECWWMAGSDFNAHRVPFGLEMVG